MAVSRERFEGDVPPKLDKDSKSGRINVIVTEALLSELDAWRREHPGLPNKSEAIRILVTEALALWRSQKAARNGK